MAFSFGRIEEFDVSIDNRRSYVERLEHYFKANKIDDSLQKDAALAGKRLHFCDPSPLQTNLWTKSTMNL